MAAREKWRLVPMPVHLGVPLGRGRSTRQPPSRKNNDGARVGHPGFAYECHLHKKGLLAQEMAASARFPLAKLSYCPRSDR